MVLVKNGPFFHLFFKDNIRQENVFYDILERRNAFLGYKNKKFKKSNNRHFSKGLTPWFSSFYFVGNVGQENVIYDILERKNAFLGYKNKKFKKSKNWHFPKGVNPWFFCPKIAIFQLFFLCFMAQENVFHDILERKNVFLGHKNKKFRK